MFTPPTEPSTPTNMARRLALKDCSTIYYAYRLGINSKSQEVFGEVKSVSAFVADKSGTAFDSRMGTETSYDVQFIVNSDENTSLIDEYTRVWLKMTPRTSDDKPDYEIISSPERRNGQLQFSCRSTATNKSEFYYEHNGEVLRFMAVDDLENLKFIVPINMYLPIDFDTKLWYDEPEDVNDTEFLMKLVDKEEVNGNIEYTVELK